MPPAEHSFPKVGPPGSFWSASRRRLLWALRSRRAVARTTWRDFAALGGVFCVLGVATVAYRRSGVMLNHTASMPVGLYRVVRSAGGRITPALRRGDAVVWCLPAPLVAEARRRHYLLRGGCPGDAEPMLKVLGAVPGDTVTVDRLGLAVNGVRLPNSHPLAFDSHGRRLASMPRGEYVVRPGTAWLWSPYHALSFDSRYYGAVPVSGLVGVARPLWIRRPKLPPGVGPAPAIPSAIRSSTGPDPAVRQP
jgi:conjugative transfer signal peptidase TraF